LQGGGGLEVRQKDQMVDLPGPIPPLADGADLGAEYEPGAVVFAGGGRGQGQARGQGGPRVKGRADRRLEGIKPLLGILKLFPQFRQPLGVGPVPGSQEADALDPGPAFQVRGGQGGAGGPGLMGMDVEVGDDPHRVLYGAGALLARFRVAS
jgi:hypothetical protein